MTQLVFAAAGAIIGSFVPGVGTAWGWAIGAAIGGVVAAAEARPDPPKVNDLKAPQVDYGSPLYRLYGSNRTAGSLAWYSEKHVTAGDDGDCLDPEVTPDTADIDVFYIVSIDSEVIAFTRVWKNGELVFTQRSDSNSSSLAASLQSEVWDAIEFLDGNPAQMPHPVMEAVDGVGNVPAYRYRQGIFITGLKLGPSGQMPLMEFEVITKGTVAPDQADGLLNHFDELDGSQILSAIGPNLSKSGALSTSAPKFGANAGDDTGGYSAIGVTGSLEQSWIFEGWFKPTDAQAPYFALSGGGFDLTLSRFALFGDSAVFSSITSALATGSGRFGGVSQLTILDEWNHVGVQYNADTGELTAFTNGASLGSVVPGASAGIFFPGGVFSNVTVGGVGCKVDEVFFHFVEASNLLYGVSYAVPTEPFEGSQGDVWTLGTEDLDHVLQREWNRVTEDEDAIDVTDVAGIPVRGFKTSGSVVSAFESLAPIFHFGGVVSDKLYIRLQGGAVAQTLAFNDLAAGEDKPQDEPFVPERANEEEIVRRALLTAQNYLDDYAAVTESGDNGIEVSNIVDAKQTDVVMTPSEAKAVAETLAGIAAIAATRGAISVTDYYAQLEPTDRIRIPDQEGTLYTTRIVRETYAAGLKALEWVRDDTHALVSPGITSADYTQSLTVAAPQDAQGLLLDTAIWRDADDDAGFYAVEKGSTKGARLLNSLDGVAYSEATNFTPQAVFGVATTTLGDWDEGRMFDERNSVTVNVGEGELVPSTRAAMLADEAVNAFALGVDGRWELGQFRTPTLISPGVYKLTGLLRGSRGTEWASVDHVSAENFVLLTGAARRVDKDTSEIGVEEYYKFVATGRLASSAASVLFTDNAVGLKPFSPVHVRVTKDSSGAITIDWLRRTRLATRFVGATGSTVPLGEASESYEVDVFHGATLVRTLTASSQTVDYTVAQQAADTVTSSDNLDFIVYQISATVGRGYPSESASGMGGHTPVPEIATVTVGGVFAAGVPLFVSINGVQTTRTTLLGDTNLNGVATALAAAMTGYTGYTIAAVGSVITITGPSSTPFTLNAGIVGSAPISTNVVQAAAAMSAGSAKQIQLSMTTPFSAAAGATFSVTFENSLVPGFGRTVTYSHTGYAGESAQNILTQLAGATPTVSDAAPSGISWNFVNGPGLPPVAVFPIGELQWTGSYFSSQAGAIFYFSIYQPGSLVVPAATPQVVDFALVGFTGTPTTGHVYRITLGSTNYDYTVLGGDDYSDVMTALAALIDADALYLGVTNTVPGVPAEVTTGVRVTAVTANVPFTYSGRLIPGSVSLATAITQAAV